MKVNTGVKCVDDAFDMEQYPTWVIALMFVGIVIYAIIELSS